VNAAHLEFCASSEWRQLLEDFILPEALRDVELGPDVIEVGPGPGFTTDLLRSRANRVTAVEIDPILAEALTQRLAGTNVQVIRGNATALDLPADRFTGAASFNMLHHVPSDETQDRIFAELARVLRAGGAFVATDSVASEELEAFHTGDTYHPIDPARIAARLDAAGFNEVSVRTYDLGWISTARAG
jgi:SAM-dependent methyltransferase